MFVTKKSFFSPIANIFCCNNCFAIFFLPSLFSPPLPSLSFLSLPSLNSNDTYIRFQMQVKTTGWVGLGFNSNPGTMKGGDYYLGRVFANGTAEVQPFFLFSSLPTPSPSCSPSSLTYSLRLSLPRPVCPLCLLDFLDSCGTDGGWTSVNLSLTKIWVFLAFVSPFSPAFHTQISLPLFSPSLLHCPSSWWPQ